MMKIEKILKKQNVRVVYPIFAIFIILISSCSGYKVKNRTNPWKQYNISHVTIPLFINETLFPGMNTAITANIIEELGHFTGLKVSSGESNKADALLLGVITGNNHLREALPTIEKKYLGEDYSESLGTRRGIYTPRRQTYQVTVRLILIKNPTTFDRVLLKSRYKKHLIPSSKVIFNQVLTISQAITRNIWNRKNVDSGGVVNFTQNEGIIRRSYSYIGKEVSRQFKELILYAF